MRVDATTFGSYYILFDARRRSRKSNKFDFDATNATRRVRCERSLSDVEAISKTFSKLRPDKAMGPDGLASMLLIKVQDLITYPLYLLFKKSLSDTVIPDDWKQAVVTPIFKKGNRNKTENYPVSYL